MYLTGHLASMSVFFFSSGPIERTTVHPYSKGKTRCQ